MFNEKDIIRKVKMITSAGNRHHFNVCLCKNCKKEIKISRSSFQKHKGYCKKCISERVNNLKLQKRKDCNKCGINQSIDNFRSGKQKYVQSICIRCYALKKYGLNLKQYLEILERQNNTCAICKEKETITIGKSGKMSLSVDHCHTTGKIRGLLCYRCNTSIGHLKEDIEIFENAIKYLKNS